MTTLTPLDVETPGLAQDGGPKAFSPGPGNVPPKVGVEEFLSIAERFGFNPEAMGRLSAAVSDKDLPVGGPHLGRYYGNPKPIKGEQFEALAREKFGVKYALAVSSGTAALHCAMVGAGAGPGKEVICPATGFVATSMAAALVGATPVFCDVDESLQMDPSRLEALVTPRTVVIVPTHHMGFVCDMDPVLAIARKHNLKVIEDCAQSPGASYRGRPVGSLGDFGCFSISCYKIIGGGEGGMVITKDERSYDRVRQVAEAGGLWRSNRFAPERYPGELFVGANYRLSELESAINVVQLRKLDGVVSRHRAVWRSIRERLGAFDGIIWQKSNDPEGDIGYLLRFFPKTHDLGRKIRDALMAEGIGAGYRGGNASPDWHVYRDMFPLFRDFSDNCRADRCPVGADLHDRSVSVGLNQWWTPEDCEAVAAGINKVLSAFCTLSHS
ncbi:MAG: DegT/DnrJ/EryC1/StrS family aminotransferase [Verrucomicrobiae bacterium]